MPDHEYPSNVELVLTVTDPDGGTTVERTQADYRTVDVDVTSSPSGVPVLVGSTDEPTPFTREVAIGATTSVSVLDPVVFGGQPLGFDRWLLDGNRVGVSPALEFAPTADTELRAEFANGAVDDERPSAPRGLRTVVSGQDISLSWTASTDNVAVTGYRIHRSTDGSLGSVIASIGPTAAWTDDSVVAGTSYTYAVRAIDAVGNQSWRSNLSTRTAVGGGPVDTQRPTPPTGLRAEGRPWGIELTWNASADDVGVVDYVIYRSTDGTVGAPWRTVDGAVLRFENGGAQPDVEYTFSVRARDAAGNLSWRSNLSSAQRL